MPVNKQIYLDLKLHLGEKVKLVAVSKTKPAESIMELLKWGQRDFGENYVQELVDKYNTLPKDIRWHFIGHLQSNKVKYIAPFIDLIHGVDSLKLLTEINKEGKKNNRVINCLLQVHIAVEETKFGLNEEELEALITQVNMNSNAFKNARVCGLMGMASFTEDVEKVRSEFKYLSALFNKCQQLAELEIPLTTLSMGMSADYKIAIEEGSNMVRVGSLLFGERNNSQ